MVAGLASGLAHQFNYEDAVMNVSEFITLLQTHPQDMQVVRVFDVDYMIMDQDDFGILEACEPRADGYVRGKSWQKPDELLQKYLLVG